MDELTRGLVEIRHAAADAGRTYERIYAGEGIRYTEAFDRWLFGLLGLRPGDSLLDVACGEGQLLHLARAAGVRASGVDFSPRALRRADDRGSLAVADGAQLPFAAGRFDAVTSIGSLEHYVDPVAGARELARVLRSAGRAVVLLPNTFGLRWNVAYAWRHGAPCDDGQPLQRYGTRLQWARILEAAGLAVVEVIGAEGPGPDLATPAGWLAAMRHPSRWLVPLAARLPVDMASLLVFRCRKA
jgi:SAM-dependent methyltransferase